MKRLRIMDNYADLRQSLSSFWEKRTLRTREEIIQEISVWVRDAYRNNLGRWTPLSEKKYAQNEKEYSLGKAFDHIKARLKKEGKLDWWTLFPEDVQAIWREVGVLDQKRRTQQEWIQEISTWVREAYRSKSGRWTPLSDKKYAQDEEEASLGEALKALKGRLKKKGKLDWWTLFPEDVQAIWREAGVLEKKVRTRDEIIQEISIWVREAYRNNLGRWTPLSDKKYAQDEEEASLGEALKALKARLKKEGTLDWWTLFPEDVQSIWREAGVLEKKLRSGDEIIQEISTWVREAYRSKSGRWTPLSDKKYAQDEEEASLGEALKALKGRLKKKGKLDWWTLFPEDVQAIWREAGVLEKKVRTRDEIIQEISTWVREAYRSKSGRWTPLSDKKYAQDEEEASLGSALNDIKVRLKKEGKLDWWTLFPEDVQSIWREAGVLEKRVHTRNENIQEISIWVREAYRNNLGRWTPLSEKKYAQDEEEASLGETFKTLKRRLKKQGKLDWWTLFPEDVQAIWREAKVIPAK